MHFAIHIVWRANVICTYRKSGIARKTTVAYPELRFIVKVHKRTINKWGRDTILAALEGVVNKTDCRILKHLKEELDMLRRHKVECLVMLRDICMENYKEQILDIQTIPGICEQGAMQIIAETGVDMKAFITAAMLVGWA